VKEKPKGSERATPSPPACAGPVCRQADTADRRGGVGRGSPQGNRLQLASSNGAQRSGNSNAKARGNEQEPDTRRASRCRGACVRDCVHTPIRAHGSSVEGYPLVVIVIVILILLAIPQPSMIRSVDGSRLMHAVRGCAADQSDQHGMDVEALSNCPWTAHPLGRFSKISSAQATNLTASR